MVVAGSGDCDSVDLAGDEGAIVGEWLAAAFGGVGADATGGAGAAGGTFDGGDVCSLDGGAAVIAGDSFAVGDGVIA